MISNKKTKGRIRWHFAMNVSLSLWFVGVFVDGNFLIDKE
jgi:nitric oxide reductase large subunit